ncbi:MAG: 5'/3'-nucleotidase SurE [Candidatus Hodarchaeales archaeon]|jgi:5'-nucleotidase
MSVAQIKDKYRPNLLLSADDGIYSQGIKSLALAIDKRDYDLTVIAPRSQRSGVGKAITFDEPIRVEEIQLPYLGGKSNIGWRTTGTPADGVIHAIYRRSELYPEKPFDLVVSGINAGENTSIHAVLTSGTCAVTFEAAILGYPGIAFSLDVTDDFFFDDRFTVKEYKIAAEIAGVMIDKVLLNGLPKGVAFLNINFPDNVQYDTPMKICSLAPKKYVNYTIRKEDPRGVEYYWIWGDRLKPLEGTDAHAVRELKEISITPISLGIDNNIENFKKNLNYLLD